MDDRIAVIGLGATGVVLAAAILSRKPDTILVARRPRIRDELEKKGIRVSGELKYAAPVRNVCDRIESLGDLNPNIIFIATKTFHLPSVIKSLQKVYRVGTKIISTHNGLGTEDLLAEAFGADAVFRMSLHFGVSLKGPGEAEVAFFRRPNPLGALTSENRGLGLKIAAMLSAGGLDTNYVDDIKLAVWEKMIHKCTLASICAVTDMTIREVLSFPPTREIANACFNEILAVAKAKGYDLGREFLNNAVSFLEKVGNHKDSMCFDLANKTRTEIDFLGGKVVEYGKETGIPTPCYSTMSSLVRALESKYLEK
jgi:2-dehydropantoate 2-reductase